MVLITKIKNISSLLRVKQWSKNLICFAGLIFGGHILDTGIWWLSMQTFISFCLVSSSVYIFNDIIDKDADSLHPKKKNRPIAKGEISVAKGLNIGIFTFFLGLFYSFIIDRTLLIILLIYLGNNIFYSFYLKRIPIADVFSIAFGFILRLISGIFVIGEIPTYWIILSTMFLALFLGFSKRRAELISTQKNGKGIINQRTVLNSYNKLTLDSLVNESSFGAVITYSLFTITSGKNPSLIITVPIVYFAIIHYKMLLFRGAHGEEPELVLLNDRVIWFCVFLWLIFYIIILYFDINLFSY